MRFCKDLSSAKYNSISLITLGRKIKIIATQVNRWHRMMEWIMRYAQSPAQTSRDHVAAAVSPAHQGSVLTAAPPPYGCISDRGCKSWLGAENVGRCPSQAHAHCTSSMATDQPLSSSSLCCWGFPFPSVPSSSSPETVVAHQLSAPRQTCFHFVLL